MLHRASFDTVFVKYLLVDRNCGHASADVCVGKAMNDVTAINSAAGQCHLDDFAVTTLWVVVNYKRSRRLGQNSALAFA